MGSSHAGERNSDSANTASAQPSFIDVSAPISLTVGGAMAFFAGMADGTQAEKQQAVQNAFRTGAMLGKLVSYPFLNKSISSWAILLFRSLRNFTTYKL